jgi:hypothetical protein
MFDPTHARPGLFPQRLQVHDGEVEFTFALYDTQPQLLRTFTFRSFTPGGVSTSQTDQRIKAGHGQLGGPNPTILPGNTARLVTMPDSAPASLTQRLLLFVGGGRTEIWDVTFEADVSGFALDGLWS